MKIFTALVSLCICVFGLIGCNQQPHQVKGNKLLVEGDVVKIGISSLSPKDITISLVEKILKQLLIICLH